MCNPTNSYRPPSGAIEGAYGVTTLHLAYWVAERPPEVPPQDMRNDYHTKKVVLYDHCRRVSHYRQT